MARFTRRRLWKVVNPETDDRSGQRIESIAYVVASLNVIAVVVESIEPLHERYALFFDVFAIVSVFLFTILYVVRVWAVATTNDNQRSEKRLQFVRRPLALLDLTVIGVFWLGLLIGDQLFGFVRILWFARFFNLPRLRRSRTRFKRVITAQSEDLAIAFSGAGMLVLASSTLMYVVERSAQPEAFSSIPDALWWGIVTLTTVGYGDVVPVTPLGRFLGAVTTFGGVAFFALPSSILAAGFFAEREDEREQTSQGEIRGQTTEHRLPDSCPHCGEPLDTPRS